ncbi:MAG: hypothetical protein KAR57_02010 [Bacteroidales bacterium]|nr:hypothetical protein [Bacteroidales bacterium]
MKYQIKTYIILTIALYSLLTLIITLFSCNYISNSESGNIGIYSFNRLLVKKESLENNSEFRTYLNDQRGIYLVKLTLDRKVYYAKIQN